MTMILQIVLTYLIFILFFVMISILGAFIFQILKKPVKIDVKFSKPEFFFINFIIGIVIYISWGYITLFFDSFNFYSIYLPLIMISIFYALTRFRKNSYSRFFNNIKHYFKSNYKSLSVNLFFLIAIVSIQLIILCPVLFENSALLSKDPYYWTKHVLFLNKYGYINFEEHGSTYPFGFTLYCGGSLLISPDFLTTYSFMKFAGLPLLSIYLIILYIILKKFIRNKWIIFISLVICLSNIYFLYRVIMFLSSAISVLIILIGILILITKSSNILLGFVISGSFLFNPVYAFFLILVIGTFYGIKFVKNIHLRKVFVKKLFLIGLISSVPLIFYTLSLFLYYNSTPISVMASFLRLLDFTQGTQPIFTLGAIPIGEILSINLLELIVYLIYLGIFHFLPIMSLFLKNDFDIVKEKDFNLFLKVAVLLTSIIIITTPFLNLSLFFNIFFMRVLEGFNPFIIIAIGLILSRVHSKLIIIGTKIEAKLLRFKIRNLKKFLPHLSKKSVSIGVMLSISLLTYSYAYNNFVYIYLYDDSMMDCVFYINQNFESNAIIGVHEINDTHTVYDLLQNFQLVYYNQLDNWTSEEFTNFTQDKNLDALIINLGFFDEEFIEEFYNNTSFIQVAGGRSVLDYQLFEIL